MSDISSSYKLPLSSSSSPATAPAPTTASSAASNSIVNAVSSLVGPISEQYCYYFYILSILAIVFFAIIFVVIVYTGVTKKMGFSFFFLSLLYSTQFLLLYLQNRLLYNMCIQSI